MFVAKSFIRRFLYSCYILGFISQSSIAQLAPTLNWSKRYGGTSSERFQQGVPAFGGGYIFVGSAASSNGNLTSNYGGSDAWVAKIDEAGTLIWQKNYGGRLADKFNSIVTCPDGTYLLLGTTSSNDSDVVGNHGNSDLWLVKISRG